MCLSADKLNDGNIDCLGTFDEPKCCGKLYQPLKVTEFYCNMTKYTPLSYHLHLCDGQQDCWQGEDEKLCHHNEVKHLLGHQGICQRKVIWKCSDIEEFLCNLLIPD